MLSLPHLTMVESSKLPWHNLSLKKALATVPDELRKAQLTIFVMVFMLNFLKFAAILPFATLNTHLVVSYSIGVVVTVIVLKLLLSRPQYLEILIHIALVLQLQGLWQSAFFGGNGLHIHTLLNIFMPIMWSFYGLGRRWGMIYSILYTLLVPVYLLHAHHAEIALHLLPLFMNFYSAVALIVIDFGIIITAHYYYQRALTRVMHHQKKLNNQLINLAKAKSDFLSAMSHELRTPLGVVVGTASLLQRDAHILDQRQHLDNLKFSSQHLMLLINDILDFNKIEQNKIELESIPFSLPALVKQVCLSFKDEVSAKGLYLDVWIADELSAIDVVGDSARFTQILYNLIGNAAKFTVHGGITVECHVLKKRVHDATVRLVVEDTGIGISPDRQEAIFQPFSQESAGTNRQFGGSGLGLAIVKNLIELHHGKIYLESSPGEGTRFHVDITFPITKAHAQETDLIDISQQFTPFNLKVLLVEDNAMNRYFIQQTLANWGVEVGLAENGKQALLLLERSPWDVVLMDLQMPEMDGFETVRQMRGSPNPAITRLPVIALTASASAETLSKIEESRMDGHVKKPFLPDTLYRVLKQYAR
ncbi:ATP-binding protein [Parapedobacter deserti]|uniref:histidine kinase n=1 Tax=Parapedobacter deserti TaxID=1912957 RepID=A0ABV7JKJ4_9SPHI